MTQKTYKTLRAKPASGTVLKAHLIHDDTSYPNGMYGVAHVFGDTDKMANKTCNELARRWNAHEDLVYAVKEMLAETETLKAQGLHAHVTRLSLALAKARGEA
jgi:hypothetical protein